MAYQNILYNHRACKMGIVPLPYSNTVSANYSAILGGCGNSDNVLNYAGVFGKGIIAQAANTFHVECLNACNTPCWPGGATTYPIGTIFQVGTSVPLTACALPLFMWIV